MALPPRLPLASPGGRTQYVLSILFSYDILPPNNGASFLDPSPLEHKRNPLSKILCYVDPSFRQNVEPLCGPDSRCVRKIRCIFSHSSIDSAVPILYLASAIPSRFLAFQVAYTEPCLEIEFRFQGRLHGLK